MLISGVNTIQMEHQFLLEMAEGVITVEVAIAKYAKLAQIQCGSVPELRIGNRPRASPPDENPRLNLLRQLLEEEVTGKVCVVYHDRTMLPNLIKALVEWDPKPGLKAAYETGRNDERRKARLIPILTAALSSF